MPRSRRPWKEDDVAKLRALAGNELGERIAAELDRSLGALAVKACELGLLAAHQSLAAVGARSG